MSDPRDLTVLADVKAWLNLAGTGDDGLLAALITAASVAIETALNRSIAAASYSDVCDGTGGRTLAFAATPVTAVTSLSIDGRVIPAAPDSCSPGYLFSPTRLSLLGYRFTPGLANIAVSYVAGFAETPPDLANACMHLVAARYRERDRIGLNAKGLAGESTSFVQAEFPASVAATIARYRKVAPL
jgi:uncharacterized phiE125 gp8 family phage protein